MNPFSYSHLDNGALVRRLADAVAHECTSTADVIALIGEVDERRLFVPAGFPSMFLYCVHVLHMSDDAAYRRIHAARTARRLPAVLEAVADGRLHLTAVVLLGPHLTAENDEELLAAATHKTKVQVQQLLAERFPQPGLPERIEAIPAPRLPAGELALERVSELQTSLAPERAESAVPRPQVTPLAPERFALQATIERGTHDKMRYAQALLGHQLPAGEIAVLVDRAFDALIRELEKTRFAATSRPRAARHGSSADPRHIPANVKRTVWERDGGQCGFVSESGQRCPARSRLEFDHVDPVARGGEATVENIRLRCRVHNEFEAECVFGAGFMETKREAARAARQAAAGARAREAVVKQAAAEARRAAAEAEAQAAEAENDPDRSVVPWLRRLGYRLQEAREAAAFCANMPDASLEERVRAAIRFLYARRRAA